MFSLKVFCKTNTKNLIEIIDCKQGDIILIKTNDKNILIDSGVHDENMFYRSVLKKIKYRFNDRIDLLIITHRDFDHIGNLDKIYKHFNVENLFINRLYKNFDYGSCDSKIYLKEDISEITISKNVKIKNLLVDSKFVDNENDDSICLKLEIDNKSMLLLGDVTNKIEMELIKKYKIMDIDILKVSHHGSKYSTSKEFLNIINPKYAMISAGRNNRFNHPNSEIIKKLNDINCKIFTTQLNGAIKLEIENNEIEISKILRKYRLW